MRLPVFPSTVNGFFPTSFPLEALPSFEIVFSPSGGCGFLGPWSHTELEPSDCLLLATWLHFAKGVAHRIHKAL